MLDDINNINNLKNPKNPKNITKTIVLGDYLAKTKDKDKPCILYSMDNKVIFTGTIGGLEEFDDVFNYSVTIYYDFYKTRIKLNGLLNSKDKQPKNTYKNSYMPRLDVFLGKN